MARRADLGIGLHAVEFEGGGVRARAQQARERRRQRQALGGAAAVTPPPRPEPFVWRITAGVDRALAEYGVLWLPRAGEDPAVKSDAVGEVAVGAVGGGVELALHHKVVRHGHLG
jgi:hypothetical protein